MYINWEIITILKVDHSKIQFFCKYIDSIYLVNS